MFLDKFTRQLALISDIKQLQVQLRVEYLLGKYDKKYMFHYLELLNTVIHIKDAVVRV